MRRVIKGGQKEKLAPRKWRIRINLGFDPETGKYIRSPSRIVNGNAKDADLALAAYREELQEQIDNPGKHLTFRGYANDFFAMRETLNESPLSRKRERNEIDKLINMFGDLPIDELSPIVIKKAYVDATSNGMTAPTLKRIHKRLKMILEEAFNDEILERNPASKVKVPDPPKKSPPSLTQKEAERLVACLNHDGLSPLTIAIRLMLFGGFRKGEVLGLTWEYVDFEHSAIYIAQQFSNDRQLRPPKSNNSRRWVALDDKTMDCLRDWKKEQHEHVAKNLSFCQTAHTPVVNNPLGGHIDPTNFNRQFRDYCVNNNFGSYENTKKYVDDRGYVRTRQTGYSGLTPHGLRHTHTTLLIGAQSDVKTVARRLGHSSVSLTLNIYADAIRENDYLAAQTIQTILGHGENDAD